ncbi:DDHD domain-containing protein [Pestalotiopsis sp. NC0098]|nr:DDHD domain-containing protein [Pestalotiopsis sp. NC0098]
MSTPPPSKEAGASDGKKMEAAEKKQEKSYFASAVESINPWNSSRSNTPAPNKDKEMPPPPKPAPTKKADDHSSSTLYGQSFRKYPPDCPPLHVKWFHAVDVPKRKPQYTKTKKEKESTKPPPVPKKFNPFSKNDSKAIENAYQKLLEEWEDNRGRGAAIRHMRSDSLRRRTASTKDQQNTSIDSDQGAQHQAAVRVPVNEDFLFDVDIEQRELAPVYWLGPIYDVQRGTWFYQEGSTLRPCEENLAAQLEEGYLKIKPWTYPETRSRSSSGARSSLTPKGSRDSLRSKPSRDSIKPVTTVQTEPVTKGQPIPTSAPQHQPQTYRLFGAYMSSVATYQDSTTAWLSTDGVLSWVTSSVYQRFAGGGYMSGVKLVRGYTEPKKTKDEKRPITPTTATLPQQPPSEDDKESRALKRRSAPPLARAESTVDLEEEDAGRPSRESQLQRQISNYMETADDPEAQQEQIRKREEQEIQDDYNAQAGETQGRDIEHLVLVTHGIGQQLSLRMDSINFVHDVNVLRKTLKGVYSHSDDLRALNSENNEGTKGPGNCKVQVLPVCWRHLLDFPKRQEKKAEHDIGMAVDEEDEYPSLEDITIEGIAFARSLISDLALDVLLYQSAYRKQISDIVLQESNRIYKLFKERNPEFKGKVHIMGHSLGSAIMFDILCRQREAAKQEQQLRNPLRMWPSSHDRASRAREEPQDLAFDFDTDDFYCLGSPVGLFQMLKGRTMAARRSVNAKSEGSRNPDYLDDPFNMTDPTERLSPITGHPFSVSSPKVAQMFNIFHPSDPIAYRLEPLISPAMSTLKPQLLPYTKKGIFDAMAPQGLSGIGMKVGQSVSGLWSSISGSITSSLLNRSLGLSNDDVANFQAQQQQAAGNGTNPAQAGNNNGNPNAAAGTSGKTSGGAVISDTTAQQKQTEARKKALARRTTTSTSVPTLGHEESDCATLIDDDMETLFSQFQKKRVEAMSRADEAHKVLGDEWKEQELKAQKLRREELKVRALNRNGRVDYSIQESALDFNPINTIASHMSYWQDEDVSHFILSQLLSRPKKDQVK